MAPTRRCLKTELRPDPVWRTRTQLGWPSQRDPVQTDPSQTRKLGITNAGLPGTQPGSQSGPTPGKFPVLAEPRENFGARERPER
jgi:hypothetical protein